MGISLIIAACIVALPLFRLCHIAEKVMAQIDDLNAAIAAEAASIEALATAIGNIASPPDLAPAIDAVNANRARVDALTAGLGGTPPGP